MISINEDINALLQFALKRGLLKKEDYVWAANQLIGLFNQAGFKAFNLKAGSPDTVELILERLLDQAVRMGLAENTGAGRDLFDTRIMGLLTPRPSEVIRRFRKFYEQSPITATDYFYDLSVAVNYVRKNRTDRNITWFTPSRYGNLAITINVSKPEKDPRDIAAARNAPAIGYPACLLCRENEGYFGNPAHPARQNLRLVPLEMGGEEWFLQYSPYVYYNEHCIILSGEHRPMKIGRRTFENLITFLNYLPHYFIGSNADLPIVGGSILNHDHYQGGRHTFPMDEAEVEKEYRIFPGLALGRLRWPLSGLRLRGNDAEAMIRASEKILEAWRNWSDESVGLLAESGGELHNTLTPIARRRGGDYVFDLVLRNNRVTADHPLGLFHPHEDVHNVKKENIGLIEVLGLAILPPRLAPEMEMLKEALLTGRAEVEGVHAAWYPELKKELSGLDPEETEEGLRLAVGLKFIKGLEDAGVFKRNEAGRAAFERFVHSLAGKER